MVSPRVRRGCLRRWFGNAVAAGLVALVTLALVPTAPRNAGSAPPPPPRRPLVGEPAPFLGGHVKWLSGTPLPRFDSGKVYLVDLWATWCLSCVARMPHLSQLAATQAAAGLEVVGVAVLQPQSGMTAAEFIARNPTSMRYPVAEELSYGAVPELLQGTVEAGSIPFLFIIDRAGRIAWRSDPRDPYAGLEQALAAVLDGSWDLETAAAFDAGRAAAELEAEPLLRSMAEISRSDDRSALEETIDRLVLLDPGVFGTYVAEAFRSKVAADRDGAIAYAATRIGLLAGHPSALLSLARAIAESSSPAASERALVVSLASAANALKGGRDPDFTWALAKLQFDIGDAPGAAQTMRDAIAEAERQDWDAMVLSMMRREATRYDASATR